MTKRGNHGHNAYHETARIDSRLDILGPEHRDTFERYRCPSANILATDPCDLDDLDLPRRAYHRRDSIRYSV